MCKGTAFLRNLQLYLYVVQHVFVCCATYFRARPRATDAHPADSSSMMHKMQKSAERPQMARAEPMATKEKISRHRRNGEKVALCHYLARAAMEHMAHRIPGAYSEREQICTAVLRATQKKYPRLSQASGTQVVLSMKNFLFAYH